MKNVLITGGTGMVGTALTKKLQASGYSVSYLSRSLNKNADINIYKWDVNQKSIDENAIINADYIIHLAGTNIGDKKWTAKVKKEIILSRKESTQLLYESIKKHNPKLKAFISTSAVGYYGIKESEHTFTEEDSAGKDFLAGVCVKWEENVSKISALGIRTAIIRTGVVLSKTGGALEQMAMPVKFGAGAALGSGKQYIPWIHIEDICAVYLKAIQDEEMHGIYNGVGTQHINNKDFTKTIAKVLNRPFFLPNIPSFVIKTALGERAVIALKGNKVSPEKLLRSGFSFKYENLEKALEDLLT